MKTYFNDAVIGNSRVLACIDRKGELVRVFWPHIDYPQHVDRFRIGFFEKGVPYSTKWLDGDEWKQDQNYIEDTNILTTVYTSSHSSIKITGTDFVPNRHDVVVRSFRFENTGTEAKTVRFLAFSNFLSHTNELRSSLFNFSHDCIVSYRNNEYIAVASGKKAVDFQIGENSHDAANRSEFYGINDIGMTGETVQAWEVGELLPNQAENITIYLCFGKTLQESLDKAVIMKSTDLTVLAEDTKNYWLQYLKQGKSVTTGSSELDSLYKRSLLTFKLMGDEKSGGLLAAPEIDENFTRCGRYAYCWGRDAAFITGALDQAGYTQAVDSFYRWAVSTQGEDGSWYQRYHLDGNLAPSWGLQIDETGTLLWGILEHHKYTNNRDFLEEMWSAVKKAADFLMNFIDDDTKLPRATFDLWEERVGQHTYSAAAVSAGLKAAAEIGRILNHGDTDQGRWLQMAETIKKAIEDKLWNQQQDRFLRGINTKIEEWGFEGHGGKLEVVANPKGYKRWVSAMDIMLDVSLLGVTVPFEVFTPDDIRVVKTANAIEQQLTSSGVGGIRRYETDGYMGGNPWILTTLWMALYHIRCSDYQKAKDYLLWAAKHKTYLGLLPEQVDRNSGEPAWVIPLTWSHAMYVLVYLELADKGQLS